MSRLNLIALFVLFFYAGSVSGQSSWEFRFTPLVGQTPKIVNPSPAEINSIAKIGYEFGVSYDYMLNKKWAIGAGLLKGSLVYGAELYAPSTAFGTKQDKGTIYDWFYFDPYKYQALAVRTVRQFELNKRTAVSLIAEPSLRYYTWGADNYDTTYSAYNRATRFDPNDPLTMPPDLLIGIPATGHRLDLNIGVSAALERKISSRGSLVFGIRKNFGLKPIGAGILQVQMNGKVYTGQFNSRSGFLGIDLAYKYSLKKFEGWVREAKSPPLGRHRKAIFVEGGGNGGLSANFDMRLWAGRNDGPGIRAGIGYGGMDYDEASSSSRMIIPLAFNYIFRNERSGIETGLGVTPAFTAGGDRKDLNAGIYLNLGYRLQPLTEGLLLRMLWAPYYSKGEFHSWPGLSLGYSFK